MNNKESELQVFLTAARQAMVEHSWFVNRTRALNRCRQTILLFLDAWPHQIADLPKGSIDFMICLLRRSKTDAELRALVGDCADYDFHEPLAQLRSISTQMNHRDWIERHPPLPINACNIPLW